MPSPRSSKHLPVTAEDLDLLIGVAAPRISPDGKRIAFVRKHAGDKNETVSNIWTVETDGSSPPRQFTAGGRDSDPRWSPDGTRIAFVGAREKGHPQLYTIAADGGEARTLTAFPEGTIAGYKWSPDGTRFVVRFRPTAEEWMKASVEARKENGRKDPPWVIDDWYYRLDGDGYFGAQRFALYAVDAESGVHKSIYAKDTLGSADFDFAPDGRRIAITTNRDRKAMIRPWADEILVLDLGTGKLRPVPGLPRGPKTAVRWSPDGKRLAYAGREGDDGIYSVENLELWTCDPMKGNARSLTRATDYCLMAPPLSDAAEVSFEPQIAWGPRGKRIHFTLGWHGELHAASIAARGGAVTIHTSGRAVHDVGTLSADGKRIALARSTATTLAEIGVLELGGGEKAPAPRMLSRFNAEYLRTHAIASIKSHWVPTADGTKVQTWVMLPPGVKPGSRRKLPAVLEIHGGPHAQYGVGFFHEFQMLAAAGYVVVFSNPRGSKGYGRDHCAAIRGQWGTADWVDVQAVMDFMQSHPQIDRKRMGVMGGSYGGYMTNWVIGHSRAFRGAITDRCVFNMISMWGSSDYTEAPGSYFPGNAWDDTEALWEQSPLKHIGNARTPTLIIHSEGDLRCNVAESEQLFTALKLLNVPTRLVRYPRTTSHGMSRGGPTDMRQHRLGQILEWWSKWL